MVLKFDKSEENMVAQMLTSLNIETVINAGESIPDSRLSFHGLEIDLKCRLVKKNSKEIKFTYTEFEILCLLAGSPGKVFSKEQIYDHVWKDSYSGCSDVIVTHIRHIREKMEDEPGKPIFIQTVWGSGYRFNKSICSDS